MMSQRSVKANLDKIQAILEITTPNNIKELQSLNGRVAALNRFVSRVTDKCLPFFKTLKKAFKWIDECQKDFEELKAYLAFPSLLSSSKPDEELSLYLAVSPLAVSLALIRDEYQMQLLVYYTSRALRRAEERYPPMEKLALVLITTTHNLRPYFYAHTIVVQTDKPLWKTMNNLKAAKRFVLWAIELSDLDMQSV